MGITFHHAEDGSVVATKNGNKSLPVYTISTSVKALRLGVFSGQVFLSGNQAKRAGVVKSHCRPATMAECLAAYPNAKITGRFKSVDTVIRDTAVEDIARDMDKKLIASLESPKPKGYHTTVIPKGVLGQTSKIREELLELEDAEKQGNRILVMCELADLYGALVAKANALGISSNDLKVMSEATARAFKDGTR